MPPGQHGRGSLIKWTLPREVSDLNVYSVVFGESILWCDPGRKKKVPFKVTELQYKGYCLLQMILSVTKDIVCYRYFCIIRKSRIFYMWNFDEFYFIIISIWCIFFLNSSCLGWFLSQGFDPIQPSVVQLNSCLIKINF